MSFGLVVQCNAYSWEADGSCRLALLTSLEDPQPGQAGREVLLDSGAGLGRVCRGGDQCCRPHNQCGEGAGDCDTDQDCAGLLVCGSDNCGRAGGRWAERFWLFDKLTAGASNSLLSNQPHHIFPARLSSWFKLN